MFYSSNGGFCSCHVGFCISNGSFCSPNGGFCSLLQFQPCSIRILPSRYLGVWAGMVVFFRFGVMRVTENLGFYFRLLEFARNK